MVPTTKATLLASKLPRKKLNQDLVVVVSQVEAVAIVVDSQEEAADSVAVVTVKEVAVIVVVSVAVETEKEAETDLALLVAVTKENLAVDMVQHQVPKVAENADIKIFVVLEGLVVSYPSKKPQRILF
jgi:hypothetical protein